MRHRCSDVTGRSPKRSAGHSSSAGSRESSPQTAIAQPAPRISTLATKKPRSGSAATRYLCSTEVRWGSMSRRTVGLSRHVLHLTQRCEAPERLQLDLTDALAGEPETAPDLLERLRLGVVEAVTQRQDLTLALLERAQRGRQRLRAKRDLDLLLRQRVVARDEVAEDRVLLLADGLVERCRRAGGGLHFERLLEREARFLRDLLERRLASELRPQRPFRAIHLLQPLDDVDRHPDRAGLVRQRACDRLSNPPRRVRRELVAAPPVELLDSADQPERALLDQVQERQALVAVVLRDRDDESQIGLDHVRLGRHIAALDPLRELDLLCGRQQRVAARLAQEELQSIGRRFVRQLDRGRRGF